MKDYADKSAYRPKVRARGMAWALAIGLLIVICLPFGGAK